MRCDACGGKLDPHSPLHVDLGCTCEEDVKQIISQLSDYLEKLEWERIERKRNRKTFVVGR